MFDDRHQSAIGSCHHGCANVCGSARIYRWEKFCREGSCGFEKRIRLSHYIFTCPVPWHTLTKSERCQVLWLIKKHHGLSWNDGHVSYWKSKRLIMKAVMDATEEDDAPPLVYIKGHEKRQWLADILDNNARNDVIIETLDADYEDSQDEIEIPGFINIRHRQWVQAERRGRKEDLSYMWGTLESSQDEEDIFNLQQLFGGALHGRGDLDARGDSGIQ
ncbi:hypothetical protein EAG_06549 [Camponotus floridanus]|uniref:Uncharacterized protein n=1 Tax=Camponotus floridanus TaxID=104421 RepID=E2A5G9_CAMFO|nr:hypothetical protein EAG_06549 [Camponotus floridanus]